MQSAASLLEIPFERFTVKTYSTVQIDALLAELIKQTNQSIQESNHKGLQQVAAIDVAMVVIRSQLKLVFEQQEQILEVAKQALEASKSNGGA